jgi:hypothetical protein
MLTAHERSMMQDIEQRILGMRAHLSRELPMLEDIGAWLSYLSDL